MSIGALRDFDTPVFILFNNRKCNRLDMAGKLANRDVKQTQILLESKWTMMKGAYNEKVKLYNIGFGIAVLRMYIQV